MTLTSALTKPSSIAGELSGKNIIGPWQANPTGQPISTKRFSYNGR